MASGNDARALQYSMQKELLVVGAGVTGSLTASILSRTLPGVSITVWEKARGAGGRMTTHRHPATPSLHVDMGAQYISRFRTGPNEEKVYTELKEAVYAELLSSHVLVPFSGPIEEERQTDPVLTNYVAPKGLSSVAKYFLGKSQAKTCFQHQLSSVTVDKTTGRICCVATSGAQTFIDGLILTIPVPQILNLKGAVVSSVEPEVKTELENVRYSSRYALGLFYDDDSPLPQFPWSAKYIDNDIIRFALWDTAKRPLDVTARGGSLLLHTSVPFGIKHLEEDKDKVQDMILGALEDVIPGLPHPSHSHIIRWRYSQVSRPYTGCPGYVVLCKRPLVVATGDGFVGSNFENCLRAAQATATKITTHFLN